MKMPRVAGLFEMAGGSPLRGYLLLRQQGGNIPPQWIKRSRESRRSRQERIAQILRKGSVRDMLSVEDWEVAYRKECFYQGIRILFELERAGKTRL
jgi:hypothetical protein